MPTATATAKRQAQNGFLRPVRTFEDLMDGRNYLLHNGQLIYKNGKGYVMTDISQDREYTVTDYMQLPESAPFQLIHGKLTHMPSPKQIHQRISFQLSGYFFEYLKNHPGEALVAPMDVHFDEKNVFQPDLLFISNERRHILKDWVHGAPDLVVEILSESTKAKDRKEKMETYGKHNVLEYWIIDPAAQTIEVFENKGAKMVSKAKLKSGQQLKSQVLQGFELAVGELFS